MTDEDEKSVGSFLNAHETLKRYKKELKQVEDRIEESKQLALELQAPSFHYDDAADEYHEVLDDLAKLRLLKRDLVYKIEKLENRIKHGL